MKKTMLLFFVSLIVSSTLLAQAPTGDPWIKAYYNNNWGRDPTAIEYNINNYNGGRWNSQAELGKYILEWRTNMESKKVTFASSNVLPGNQVVVVLLQNGTPMAVSLISNKGGGIVASGGGNIVASGGGNIVTNASGNLVLKNGTAIVASGAGNISSSTKGFGFGGPRGTLALGPVRIATSGDGAIVIQ